MGGLHNQEYFEETRDYSVLGEGADTANIQARREANNNAVEARQEEQHQKDVKGFLRDTFNKETSDERQEMMTKFGHTFSVEALQEAATDALSDFERLARDKGWDQEEQETMHASLLVLQNPKSNDTQRDQALNDIESIDQEYAEELTAEAENNYINKNENKADKTSEASQTDIQAKNNFLADSSDSFDLSTDKPDSVISATFKEEVDGIGANAQSFELDKTPQIAVTEKAPDPFTLDS